jgi:hypothetical protein
MRWAGVCLVRQSVEALPDEHPSGHVIAIATHAAMMMSDLTHFDGWHVIIDEVPSVLVLEEKQTKLDTHFFRTNYRLEECYDKWSIVTLTDAGHAIDGSDLAQDDSHRHLRIFHQRVRDASCVGGRPVLVNLTDWDDASRANVKWAWWSLFSIRQLEAFESIIFLGNNFMNSIAAKMLQLWDKNVEWKSTQTISNRPIQRKRVTVRYYSKKRAAISFLTTEQGRKHVATIAAYIEAASPVTNRSILSGNKKLHDLLGDHFQRANLLSPRQSGTSKHMNCDHAVMIYAAKANPNVRSIIKAIGVTEADWVASNEHETILQFVTRTSLRDITSSRPVLIDVYAEDQADYLKEFFDTQPHISTALEFVDLDLRREPYKQVGRPKLTPDEARIAEIQNKKRNAERVRKYRVRSKQKTTINRATPTICNGEINYNILVD